MVDYLVDNRSYDSGPDWAALVDANLTRMMHLRLGRLNSVDQTSVNVITANVPFSTGFAGPIDGARCFLKPVSDTTSTVTLNINGTGAKAVVSRDGSALSAGYKLTSTRIYPLIYVAASSHWRIDSLLDQEITDAQGDVLTNGIVLSRSSRIFNTSSSGLFTSITSIASVSFACTNASSRVHVDVGIQYTTGIASLSTSGVTVYLYVDGSNSGAQTLSYVVQDNGVYYARAMFTYSPGNTSSRTYSIRMGASDSILVQQRRCVGYITELAANP